MTRNERHRMAAFNRRVERLREIRERDSKLRYAAIVAAQKQSK